MRVQTFAIVTGSLACNARCPFCIAAITPPNDVQFGLSDINWRRFKTACLAAKSCGAATVLITGKGKPTLFPQRVSEFLIRLQPYEFPFVELQTNGIELGEGGRPVGYLPHWLDLGLTTVALSVVHWQAERNRQIYVPYRSEYIDLAAVIETLHSAGFSVGLHCTMLEGYVDSWTRVGMLAEYCRKTGVEQLTITPVGVPDGDGPARECALQHRMPEENLRQIRECLELEGTRLMTFPHGAVVYDIGGQSLRFADCMTLRPDSDDVRQLIFFPDGRPMYDWRYGGARLL